MRQVLLQRIVTGVVGAIIALAAVFIGGFWFAFVVGLCVLLASWEFHRLSSAAGVRQPLMLLALPALGFVVLAYTGLTELSGEYAGFILLLLLLYQLLTDGTEGALQNPSASFLGSVYIGWTFSVLVRIRAMAGDGYGVGVLVMLLVCVWASDIGAFFFGTAFGRHGLYPSVSPKKSIEGAAFGLLCAVIIPVVVNRIASGHGAFTTFDPIKLAAFGLVVGMAAEAGDLVESMLKRNARIKDSGRVLPGHGGILDRCDSLMFAAPVAYLCAVLFL